MPAGTVRLAAGGALTGEAAAALATAWPKGGTTKAVVGEQGTTWLAATGVGTPLTRGLAVATATAVAGTAEATAVATGTGVAGAEAQACAVGVARASAAVPGVGAALEEPGGGATALPSVGQASCTTGRKLGRRPSKPVPCDGEDVPAATLGRSVSSGPSSHGTPKAGATTEPVVAAAIGVRHGLRTAEAGGQTVRTAATAVGEVCTATDGGGGGGTPVGGGSNAGGGSGATIAVVATVTA